MATLHVRCLGTFAFRGSGEWTAGPAFKRGRELLQYMSAYPRNAASREALAEAFWPEADGDAVTHRLHIAVSGARAALKEVIPDIDPIRCLSGGYAWNPNVAVDSDVAKLLSFQREQTVDAMRQGIALYGGEFLVGDDAEWMYPLRLRCANAYAVMLEGLATHDLSEGRYSTALDHALHLAEVDRAHEGASRLVMLALVALGRRRAALAEYESLARYLKLHLGLAPCAQTETLRDTIALGGRPSSPSEALGSDRRRRSQTGSIRSESMRTR